MEDSLLPRVPSLAGMLGVGGINVPSTPATDNDSEEFTRVMKASGVNTITDTTEDLKERS